MKRVLVCAAILLMVLPVAADGRSYLRIGSTGIYCVMAPCPSFGLIPADSAGNDIASYVWAGDQLPPISGSPADQDRIVAAWAEKACLLVEGAYAEDVLSVEAIVGDCD